MPVAFMRITAKELPFEFKLTSDMTMAMGATTLADVKDVIVGARISRTGNFMPQAGDLEGETSAPVQTGTKASTSSSAPSADIRQLKKRPPRSTERRRPLAFQVFSRCAGEHSSYN